MLVSSSLEMDIAHGLYYGRMKRWEKFEISSATVSKLKSPGLCVV